MPWVMGAIPCNFLKLFVRVDDSLKFLRVVERLFLNGPELRTVRPRLLGSD